MLKHEDLLELILVGSKFRTQLNVAGLFEFHERILYGLISRKLRHVGEVAKLVAQRSQFLKRQTVAAY